MTRTDLGLVTLLGVSLFALGWANNPVSKLCFTLLAVIMSALYAVDKKPRR